MKVLRFTGTSCTVPYYRFHTAPWACCAGFWYQDSGRTAGKGQVRVCDGGRQVR